MSTVRLTYSAEGWHRRMQMSATTVFVFVEDKRDQYFYGNLCQRVCGAEGLSYAVYRSQDLPAKEPGKRALTEFHEFLRAKGALCDHLDGKRTVSIFCGDKDVDDLLGMTLESPHYIYTEFYTVENYLFAYGSLPKALSSVCGLDPVTAAEYGTLGDLAWRRTAATNWKEWVELCLFTQLYGKHRTINYSSTSSPVHDGAYGVLLRPIYEKKWEAAIEACACPAEIAERMTSTKDVVDALYAADRFDRIFNGKWYAQFAAVEAAKIIGGSIASFADRILDALQMTLDFGSAWADYFRARMTPLFAC